MNDEILQVFKLGFPWQTQDPFLFCVYHLDHFPKGKEDMSPDADLEGRNLGSDFDPCQDWRMYHGHTVPGFPSHPHRGFETVTIANKGFCDHSDSLGAAGRFGLGDVQWMTAGRGVQHSEMFPLLHTDQKNTLELFQIWLNLPRKSKFVDPHFKMLWHEDIPVIDENGVEIKLVAGKINETKALAPPPDSWANDDTNEVGIFTISLPPNVTYTLPAASEGIHRTIYFYEGNQITVSDQEVNVNHGISVHPEKAIKLEAFSGAAKLLVLQGKPIDEPVVKYGPFVMNTQEEISKAMDEYRLTQYGGWPWPHPDHVHERSRGRFAKYPDGTLVEK
ncbi:MAG: pirin [Pseudozobellia sp.]|nr:pirin [Pseudozobellia sp.]MBG50600.1 pirin [Pseudozobellia sp.]|tara:strand:+ start:118417 stop:119415 length:999 start_codon:yes stop_codon:yes gene_type:complete